MWCGVEPPGSVQNLSVEFVDQTTVVLSWLAPVDSGGRSDGWYAVDCVACDDKLVHYRPRQSHLNDTSYVPLTLHTPLCNSSD